MFQYGNKDGRQGQKDPGHSQRAWRLHHKTDRKAHPSSAHDNSQSNQKTKEGIIKRFTVDVNHDKIGKGFVAYILISADLQAMKKLKKNQYDLAKELRKFEFIERADIVSGGTDIVTIVRVKDVKEFDKVLLGKIQLIEGVANTQSLIVIHWIGPQNP